MLGSAESEMARLISREIIRPPVTVVREDL